MRQGDGQGGFTRPPQVARHQSLVSAGVGLAPLELHGARKERDRGSPRCWSEEVPERFGGRMATADLSAADDASLSWFGSEVAGPVG